MTPITVAIIDDHRVVTRSLAAWLESFSDIKVVGVCATGEEALDRLEQWKPQVVLQDLLLPGGFDGIEMTRKILERWPDIRVLALTASVDEPRMTGVLRAGAAGYLRKDAEPETLIAAVRAVAAGRTYIDPAASRTAGRGTHRSLTPREQEILQAIGRGLANKDIATAFGITEETVKTHVGHLLAKLDVDSRAQAIVEGIKLGWISVD